MFLLYLKKKRTPSPDASTGEGVWAPPALRRCRPNGSVVEEVWPARILSIDRGRRNPGRCGARRRQRDKQGSNLHRHLLSDCSAIRAIAAGWPSHALSGSEKAEDRRAWLHDVVAALVIRALVGGLVAHLLEHGVHVWTFAHRLSGVAPLGALLCRDLVQGPSPLSSRSGTAWTERSS